MTHLVIEPGPGTAPVGPIWHNAVLGLSRPAPPRTLTLGSSAGEIARAVEALEAGLGTVRVRGLHPYHRVVLRLRVPAAVAYAVPRSPLRAAALCVRSMARRQLLWWVVIAIGWSVATATHHALGRVMAIFAAAFLLAFIVHELGHVVVMRLGDRGLPAILVVGRLTGHVVRRPGRRPHDIATTIAGPVAPLVVITPLLLFVDADPVVVCCLFAVAVGHLFHLLSRVGDGDALRAALRSPV